jgi:hypothetical protein
MKMHREDEGKTMFYERQASACAVLRDRCARVMLTCDVGQVLHKWNKNNVKTALELPTADRMRRCNTGPCVATLCATLHSRPTRAELIACTF